MWYEIQKKIPAPRGHVLLLLEQVNVRLVVCEGFCVSRCKFLACSVTEAERAQCNYWTSGTVQGPQ